MYLPKKKDMNVARIAVLDAADFHYTVKEMDPENIEVFKDPRLIGQTFWGSKEIWDAVDVTKPEIRFFVEADTKIEIAIAKRMAAVNASKRKKLKAQLELVTKQLADLE